MAQIIRAIMARMTARNKMIIAISVHVKVVSGAATLGIVVEGVVFETTGRDLFEPMNGTKPILLLSASWMLYMPRMNESPRIHSSKPEMLEIQRAHKDPS